MAEDNSIFIGNKPFMNYVTGVVMQFTTKGASEVHIKARGKFISRAVDVAEVSAKRFLDGTIEVHNIFINSEAFQNEEGRDVRVSTIEIVLVRKEGTEPRVSQPIHRLERMNRAQSGSQKAQEVVAPPALGGVPSDDMGMDVPGDDLAEDEGL